MSMWMPILDQGKAAESSRGLHKMYSSGRGIQLGMKIKYFFE